uniref:PDZ domain-containing protein n=1 Tax=Panagrellus redivivus TaxID=6233 RepID=A0A7E4W9E8_PANRE
MFQFSINHARHSARKPPRSMSATATSLEAGPEPRPRRGSGLFRRCAHTMGKFLRVSKPSSSSDKCADSVDSGSVSPSACSSVIEQVLSPALLRDRQIRTAPSTSAFRRTVIIERPADGGSFGFTLQSVQVHKFSDPEGSLDGEPTIEESKNITFVSRVDENSGADSAGIQRGDVIVAIDGQVVVDFKHDELITMIQKKSKMRLIVVFEDMARKVELVAAYLDVEKKLESKKREICDVEEQERLILEGLSMLKVDDASSGFAEDCTLSEVASCSRLSVKSVESWSFDETSTQYC